MCKSKVVASWIDKEEYNNRVEKVVGIHVKNSCNLMFCDRCMKRVVFKQELENFEKFDNYGKVYHFTFSPEYEFFFNSDRPGRKVASKIRTSLMEAIKKYVSDRDGNLLGLFGWHYLGDKKDEIQTRLHSHILFTTDVSLKVYGSKTKKKHKKKWENDLEYRRRMYKRGKGKEIYTKDEEEIINNFKDKLKHPNVKLYDWDRRVKQRLSVGSKNPDFVYFYNVDVGKERGLEKGKNERVNLMEAVKYLTKYMMFAKEGVLKEKQREFLEHYVYFKQNFISPFANIRKGGKVKLRERDPMPKYINKITGREMVCVSVYELYEESIEVVPIWDLESDFVLDWLDCQKKAFDESLVPMFGFKKWDIGEVLEKISKLKEDAYF